MSRPVFFKLPGPARRILLALSLPMLAGSAFAQTWSGKTIKLTVHFPAYGPIASQMATRVQQDYTKGKVICDKGITTNRQSHPLNARRPGELVKAGKRNAPLSIKN